MRIINKLHKRGLALFMALVMCLSLVQVTALAEDEVVANDVIISEDNTQEENTHEHSYAGTVQAPTCTETGKTVYTCECGDTYDEEGEPATGHTPEVLEAVAPTETETGLTEGSRCAVCDEILTAQEIIPATGVVIPAEVQAFLDAVYALYDVPTEQLLQAVEYAETLYDLLTGEQKALEEVYQCKTALDSFRQTMTLEETVEDTVKDEKSLKEAVAKGGTVKLGSDIALNATLVITGTVALDLNGYTLSLADGKAGSVIKVDGQNIEFTLDDSSIDGTGKITGGKGGSGVPYYGNSGGGICVLNGNLVINGGTITGNTAITYGGGVFFSCSGNFVMNGGKISNNSAVGGGGVFVQFGTFTMNSGTISDNTAKGGDNRRRCGGGGVLVYRGTFHAKPQQEGNAVSISNNIANSHGGGVCAVLEGWAGDKACVVLEDVDITANKSTNGNGGGIAFEYEAVEGKLIDCRITENSSACSGGGIWNNCDLFMKGCVISGNTASDVGGGMDSTHLFTIEDCKFTNNGRQKEGFGPTKAGGGLWAAYGPYRANTLTISLLSLGLLRN